MTTFDVLCEVTLRLKADSEDDAINKADDEFVSSSSAEVRDVVIVATNEVESQ